jgi:oligoendopeptidase F
MEKKYLPWRNYEDDAFLDSGGYWYRQGHIFEDPFYYIDYCLAQVSAYEFWGKAEADRSAAWRDYLALCGEGGSKSYRELLAVAKLRDPFAEGAIAGIVAPVREWLAGVDDLRL